MRATMLTATITRRVDDLGEACSRQVTYAVRGGGGYVRHDNMQGPQVMDPWRSDGTTLMWHPPRGANEGEKENAFLRFVRRLRAHELRVARRERARW